MITLARDAGYTPYVVSMSATDDCEGTRLFFGEKDLSIPYKHDQVGSNHAILMTDVDYYTDINKWLSYGRPVLLYTFVPTKCTGRTTDFSYRLANDEVEFVVAGGSRYKHRLWNYVGDTCSVNGDIGTRVLYNIEQRDIPGDEYHKFIVFTPYATIDDPYHRLLPFKLNPIKRKTWRQKIGEHWVNYLYDPLTDALSIAKNGMWNSVELTGKIYNALQERANHKDGPLVISDLERLLRQHKVDADQAAFNGPLLFDLLGCSLKQNVVSTNGQISYLPLGSLATEDGKPMGQQLMPALVTEPALFPESSLASEEATVRGRIDSVKNTKVPPRVFETYLEDFTQCLVPDSGVGSPLDVDEVRQLQNTPQQKARFKGCLGYLSETVDNKLKSFVKAEPYSSINDPRNITTMEPALTVMLSRYTLAFKQHVLKNVRWYGPGLTPKKTAKKLQALSGNGFLTIDYSRLDGSVSEFLQTVYQRPIMRWVNESDRPLVRQYLNQVFRMQGRTRRGVQFNPGHGTRSGSPQTTDGNTVICAYVVYSALRLMSYTHKEAWELMGLFYGDDGAQPIVEGLKEAIEQVASQVGLKIKIDIVEDGEPVPYLGRYFCDPATSLDSFQDPLRTIAKLHLTANKAVTVNQGLINKASGYWVTDSKTPIIGTWAKRVRDELGTRIRGATRDEQHKMSNAWPQANAELIRSKMASVLNLTVAELTALDMAVEEAPLGQIPILLQTRREIKIPACYAGEIQYPVTGTRNSRDEQQGTTPHSLQQAPTTVQGSDNPPRPRPGRETRTLRNTGRGRRRQIRPSRQQSRARVTGTTPGGVGTRVANCARV
jgi:hypothetical protein